ncbi:MAG: aspartate--tRNA ligase, partial [Candidatus Firestonebacteria bacterium]
MLRTHYCGEPDVKLLDTEIVLCGWVDSRRDHGGLIFIDLRDRTGKVQIVVDPKVSGDAHKLAQNIRSEFVLKIKGKVQRRPAGTVNKNIKTGEIELLTLELTVLNSSKALPFQITDANVAEEIRLKYRYLDLRRPKMLSNIANRHKVTFITRDYLDKNGFLEIETPLLIKSTPEGARDFLVPSRLAPGEFYALPQSPQMLKQIMMVSGIDRYFQIAKCFRDEDLRADRQPEFTQIDIEMSYITEEDIYTLVEGMLKQVFKETLGLEIISPFPKMTYDEAMEKYGSDKPDLRYGLELVNVTELFKQTQFKVFLDAIAKGGIIKGLKAEGCAKFSRMDMDTLTEFVKQFGAKGLAWFKVTAGGIESPIAKFFEKPVQDELVKRFGAKDGDLIMLIADKPFTTNQCLDFLRRHMAEKLGLIDPDKFVFTWIVDFPLFMWNEEEKRFEPAHHPFTAPKTDDISAFDRDLGAIKARAYDIVLNGMEIGGG